MAKKSVFKKGVKVRLVRDCGGGFRAGDTGVIMVPQSDGMPGVAFDKPRHGHDLHGALPKDARNGYFLFEDAMEVVTDAAPTTAATVEAKLIAGLKVEIEKLPARYGDRSNTQDMVFDALTRILSTAGLKATTKTVTVTELVPA